MRKFLVLPKDYRVTVASTAYRCESDDQICVWSGIISVLNNLQMFVQRRTTVCFEGMQP